VDVLTGLVHKLQQRGVLGRQGPQNIIHRGHHFIGAELDALLI
jgi:hypothetical protein